MEHAEQAGREYAAQLPTLPTEEELCRRLDRAADEWASTLHLNEIDEMHAASRFYRAAHLAYQEKYDRPTHNATD